MDTETKATMDRIQTAPQKLILNRDSHSREFKGEPGSSEEIGAAVAENTDKGGASIHGIQMKPSLHRDLKQLEKEQKVHSAAVSSETKKAQARERDEWEMRAATQQGTGK